MALAAGASAQPLSGLGASSDGPLDVTADSVEYEQDRDVYVARGNVVIEREGATLQADWVAFNNVTRHGLASGNVVVVDGPDTLYADFLQFNVDTLQGVVYTGTLTNDETGFRMEGSEVRKTAEQTYVFQDGLFTTCRCPDPDARDPWAISAETADIEVGGYAVARNTSMEVLGVPVTWLPYFVYPLKEERQSGFLLPTLSFGSRSGTRIGLPFFWAARDELNVILTPHWTSERGFLGSARAEYVIGPDRDFGEVTGVYLPSDDEVVPDDPEFPYDDQRWGVDFEHVQRLPWWDLELRARGAFVSDNEFPFDIQEFGEYRRDRFLESVASLTRHFAEDGWGSFGAFTAVRWADDLQSPDDQDRDAFLLQRLPEVGVSQVSRPLPGAEWLLPSFDARYTHFWYRNDPLDELPPADRVDDLFLDTGIDALPDGLERNGAGGIVTEDARIVQFDGTVVTAAEVLAADPMIDPMVLADRFDPDQSNDNFPPGPEGDRTFQEGEPLADKGHRLLLNPRLAAPFRLDWLEVYPELGYHGTFYQTDLQGSAHRSLATGRLDLRTRLTRRYDLPFGLGVGDHLMEPQLTFYGVADLSDDDGNPLFVPRTAVPQERLRQLTLESVLRDPADRIRHLAGMVVGVSNRFYTLEPEPEPPVEGEEEEEEGLWIPSRLLADVTASVEYRFTDSEPGWFVIDGTFYPTLHTRIRTNFGYDLDDTEIAEGFLEFGWSSEAGHDLSLRYRYLRDIPRFFEDFRRDTDRFDEFEEGFNRINQISLGGRWAVTPSWALLYRLEYSLEQSLFLTHRGGVEYISKCKCWAVRVLVEDDRSRGLEFSLEYALLGLGDDTVRPFEN